MFAILYIPIKPKKPNLKASASSAGLFFLIPPPSQKIWRISFELGQSKYHKEPTLKPTHGPSVQVINMVIYHLALVKQIIFFSVVCLTMANDLSRALNISGNNSTVTSVPHKDK